MLRRSVLIFHSGALGDFVLSWPLAMALGRIFPQSRILLVTHKSKGALAEKAIRVESEDSENGWHHLFADGASLPEKATKRLADAHSIFTYQAKPGDPWLRSAATLAPEAKLISIDSAAPLPGHAIERLVAAVAPVPIVQSAVKQILSSIQSQGLGPRAGVLPSRIVIHPGSGSPKKCWEIENFIALAERLQKAGNEVVFVLGEVEHEWPMDILDRISKTAQTIWPATYLDLFAELSRAEKFIGNDSGPGQLAGVMGLKTVILFRETDPLVWGPLGPRVENILATAGFGPHDLASHIARRR